MNLIVPVDFSSHSRAATRFAAALQQTHPGQVHLVHVMVPLEEEPDYLPVQTLNAKKNIVFEIVNLQQQLQQQYNLKTSCDLLPGDIAQQIIRSARQNKADLIVMGTQGISGLRKYLYGSHTSSVIDHSPVPVLTLPEEATFKPFQRMVYATDYNYSNLRDVKRIAQFAERFQAMISLVHINQFNGATVKPSGLEDFKELVSANIRYPHITFEEHQNTDTAEGLKLFLQEEKADLLIISNRRKNLVERISGRGLNDYVFDLEIPLLVF
jgi:nucleotide-binding universal stress UspA family protein